MRSLEKISFEQFCKDICDNKKLYDEYNLPCRSTIKSAGYDFELLKDIVLKPKEIIKIPTGIKVKMNDDEIFMLIIRSSLGFKYNLRLTNQIGIIDSDYYNNISNEGHMWISIQNEGEETISLKKGTKIIQGIFVKYLTVDNEEQVITERTGWTVLKEEE